MAAAICDTAEEERREEGGGRAAGNECQGGRERERDTASSLRVRSRLPKSFTYVVRSFITRSPPPSLPPSLPNSLVQCLLSE